VTEDVENVENGKFHVLRKGLLLGRAHFDQIGGVLQESLIHLLPYLSTGSQPFSSQDPTGCGCVSRQFCCEGG
jgi:hypothetical protein